MRLALNKSSLHHQASRLKAYERFLPSLDLKRRQLIGLRSQARQVLHETEAKLHELVQRVGSEIPMLANHEVDLSDLVTVDRVDLGTENLLGVRLPRVRSVELRTHPYGLLVKPHWVDVVAKRLTAVVTMKIEAKVQRTRLDCFDAAVKHITQRVNLFDKVLIPRCKQSIRQIELYLSDTERAAVVRAKIAKGKRARASS